MKVMRCRWLAIILVAGVPMGAKVPLQDVEVTSTDRVDFKAGGTIRIIGSVGQMDVEGWDGTAVEVTVTKAVYRAGTPRGKEEGTRALNQLQVKAERKDNGELAITTTLPPRKITSPLRGRMDFELHYVIRVPKDSHLVVHHEGGDLRLENLTGPVDASVRTGDIEFYATEGTKDAIDARCQFGGVYSDFDGNHQRKDLVGETYGREAGSGAAAVHLRVGLGGIQILKAVAP